jgi:hypothetical protein
MLATVVPAVRAYMAEFVYALGRFNRGFVV